MIVLAYAYMNKKILIVEDEEDIREAISEAVTSAGYEVKTAENGQVGLDTAFEWKPDLILLDLVMPLIDGHEVLRVLREDEWGEKVKVIVLTAMDRPFNVAMANMGNAEDYIIKGQKTLGEIVEKINEVLS